VITPRPEGEGILPPRAFSYWVARSAHPIQERRRLMDDILLLLLRVAGNHNQTLVSAARIAK
jgi:hypothetical protein